MKYATEADKEEWTSELEVEYDLAKREYDCLSGHEDPNEPYPPKRKVFGKEVRDRVKNRFGGRCAYCGCELGTRFALDHRLPIAMFGKKVDVESNLYPACTQCNHYKGEELLPTFRQFLKHTYEQLAMKSLTGKMAAKFGILKPVDRITFWFETFQR